MQAPPPSLQKHRKQTKVIVCCLLCTCGLTSYTVLNTPEHSFAFLPRGIILRNLRPHSCSLLSPQLKERHPTTAQIRHVCMHAQCNGLPVCLFWPPRVLSWRVASLSGLQVQRQLASPRRGLCARSEAGKERINTEMGWRKRTRQAEKI